jgi:predicted nucleic acid-binding protein
VPRYLADTSIWSWANSPRRPDIRQKLARRVAADDVVTCVPVALEAMHRPDTSSKYEQQFHGFFEPLDWLPLTEEIGRRAMEIQRLLAATSHGAHRRPPTDFLIAATAEAHDGIVLWCFDKDFRIIAELTGQPLEEEASSGPGR